VPRKFFRGGLKYKKKKKDRVGLKENLVKDSNKKRVKRGSHKTRGD